MNRRDRREAAFRDDADGRNFAWLRFFTLRLAEQPQSVPSLQDGTIMIGDGFLGFRFAPSQRYPRPRFQRFRPEASAHASGCLELTDREKG